MSRPTVITTRTQRILSILFVGLIFLLLQVREGLGVSTSSLARESSSFWILYATYALISLLFYSIGSLCWLYAYRKQHIVATLLFVFTSLMMVAFSTISSSSAGDDFFTALGSVSTALAVLFLFFLLLYFPYNTFGTLTGITRTCVRISLALVPALCAFTVFRNICVYAFPSLVSSWWLLLCLVYYVLTASAIIWVVVYSTLKSTTVREQQQSRFFFLGTLLSFLPIVGLTVVPTLFHSRFAVDGRLSMIFLLLFPLTVAYATLRYNVLVFDSYVRRVVVTIVSCIGLMLLAFVLFTVGSFFVSSTVSVSLASLLLAGVLGGPCIWWFGRYITEKLFFPEAQYYKSIIKQSQQKKATQSFDLQQVAHLLVIDVMTTLNAPGACVFVLEEEANAYVLLSPPLHEKERIERLQMLLLEQIASCLSSSPDTSTQIDGSAKLVEQLNTSKRPLFWNEIIQPCEEREVDRRVPQHTPFAVLQEDDQVPLLAPIRSPQGGVIGLIVIDARGDGQHYAGPELEALVQLLQQSAMPIETARQFQIAVLQQEHTAQELEEAYQQQRQLNDMKDQLIIHMSHELRTPLSEVSGYLALLHEYGEAIPSEQRATFIEKATHGCDELLELLSTILSAAQSNTAKVPLHLEDISLFSLLQEEVEHLDPILAQQHRISFQVEKETCVWANEQSVRQIVRNLLSNALKYSPEHTTVTLSTTTKHGESVLCVKDEGPGIKAEEMPLLFGKFVRLARHHSGSIRGTGLGLFISKQMVEAMGGRIWAESSGKEGEGTAFFLRFAQPEVVVETRAA